MKVEQVRNSSLRNASALIYQQAREEKTVLDVSSQATDIYNGMPLEHALARSPYATILEADEPAYRETWAQMLDAL